MTEWKLVPTRPTPEMVLAGVKGQSNRATVPRDDELATGHYYDMLAAAPEPPADERDAEIWRLWGEVERLRAEIARLEARHVRLLHVAMNYCDKDYMDPQDLEFLIDQWEQHHKALRGDSQKGDNDE